MQKQSRGARMCKTRLKILALCVGLGSPHAWAATQADIDSARAKGLGWLIANQNGDGSWGKGAAVMGSSAMGMEAFNNAGVRGPIFSRAYSWVANAPAASVDSLTRQIAALSGAGGNVDHLKGELLKARNTNLGWGAYPQYGTSFPDASLALLALTSYAPLSTADAQNALCQIITSQRVDKGWSWSYSWWPTSAPVLTLPNSSTIVPTAYNLFAIDAITKSRGIKDSYACFYWSGYSSAITNGVNWILTQKNPDNGFGANGVSSVIDTALAYQVLKQFKPDDPAIGQALDFLLGKQNATDGGWAADAFQTALVLKVLPAPLTPLQDTDKDGVPDDVEAYAPGGRAVASGNGQGVAGVNLPLELVQNVTLGTFFSHTLTVSGGTPPYTWKMMSGSLPPGVNLVSDTISGTPTATGRYPFTYGVTDAAQNSTQTVGVINVYVSSPSLANGDINGDSVVDAADVALVERMMLGLMTPSATQKQRADVSPVGNPDGVIDASDVARVRLKALGLD